MPTQMADLIAAHAPREQLGAYLAAKCWRPNVECYYWGVASHGGHCLLGPVHIRECDMARKLGKGTIDQTLCWNYRQPGRREDEGQALLTRGQGWTAIGFWDRSGDQRPGSNTAFIMRGELSFEQAVRVAKHHYPLAWRRFTFEVVQVDSMGRRC